MDGKYFKPDSNFLLRKCGGGWHGGIDRISQWADEIGVDRISQLPDEIITFILSFLSLREAASTSVLSSRWSDLWKRTPNLNFNTKLLKIKPPNQMCMPRLSWDVERCKYIKMVNSVLQSHKALSLKEFKISLYVNKSAQCTVTKWLEFVFSRQVERLELDFLCERDMVALEELLRDSNVCRPQTLIFFESLKSLCLKSFKVSGEAIELFLRNCPLLERLVIQDALMTSDVEVCGTRLMLKYLDIYSCTAENSIKISAPNLAWLRVNTTSEKLLLENVPKLIGASFTCRSPSPDDAKRFASAVFCCISPRKILNLNLLYPKAFLANGFPQMPNLKKLVVGYDGVYGHGLLPLTTLIWASPRLQEFELQFVNIFRDPTAWREGIMNAERHPHRHLKVFKFRGFCASASDHIELVTYISSNCVALEKIDCSPFIPPDPIHSMEPPVIRAEAQSAKEYAKQQLHGKVPDHIQLCLG